MRGLLLCLITAGSVAGCGCNETGLKGDSATDPSHEVPAGDPIWDPAIDGLGETGWQDSTEPWCENRPGIISGRDVWSDERGVFLLLSSELDSGRGTLTNTLYFNDGSGWTRLLDDVPDESMSSLNWMMGMPGGVIFGYGYYGRVLSIYDDDFAWEDFSVWDISAVDGSLAYGALLGDPRLVKFDGSTWGPFPGEPLPFQVSLVWADEESIFCAGENGIVLSLEMDHWTVHDTGTMDGISALWGFSGNDVWAGTREGKLLHWDGSNWEHVEWPDMGDSSDPYGSCNLRGEPIIGMWGSGTTLFFHTSKQLTMWNGAGFTVLAHWPGTFSVEGGENHCDGAIGIGAIWGNSETELFLAVGDEYGYSRGCETGNYLLWWDGTNFHWF